MESTILVSATAQADWAGRSCHERGQVVRRWYELMVKHQQDLGTIMSLEQGKPQKEAVVEVRYAAAFLDVYAGEATRQYGDVVPSPDLHSRILITYQPVGVVAAITPWNFPAAMRTRKVGAAIAAGCSVVLKPAELTPITALALCDLALQAGLPPSVFQVLTGQSKVIGGVFTSHPIVRKVKLRDCGQTCVCINRSYLHKSIEAEVVRQLKAEMAKLKVGDGLAEGSVLGPLINDAGLEKVERHVKDALTKGGKLEFGGKRLTHDDSSLIPVKSSGLYYSPTLITVCTSEISAFEEETFGPIAFVYTFDEESEVLKQANSTTAGLAATRIQGIPAEWIDCAED